MNSDFRKFKALSNSACSTSMRSSPQDSGYIDNGLKFPTLEENPYREGGQACFCLTEYFLSYKNTTCSVRLNRKST